MLREATEDDSVLDEDYYVLVREDGEFIEPIHNAKADQSSAELTLRRRLTPVTFFDRSQKKEHRERDTIEVSSNTRLFNKETEEHIQADEFDIIESDDVECGYERRVTFIVDPGSAGPLRTVTYNESDLEEMFREETLVTREQQSDELEAMLAEAADD